MPAVLTIETTSAARTKRLGQLFAKELLTTTRLGGQAIVISLEGALGTGKTTFVQGMARGLGIREKVLSPSFLMLKPFRIPLQTFKMLWHADFYRLKKLKELGALKFRALLRDPANIIVIEWAERVRRVLPVSTIRIRLQHLSPTVRRLTFFA